MPRVRRRTEGFNLAFLDIMACGLGAVTLIFMLVKYQTDKPDTESKALQAELASIEEENQAIESANHEHASQIEQLKQELQRQKKRAVQVNEDAGKTAAEIIKLAKKITRLEQQKAQQTAAAKKAPAKKTEEDHLLGLSVSGPRIVILLDNSASMADERLIDIIKIKVSSTAAKKAAPKWQRAVSVAKWIIERVPDDSEYMVLNYNAKADFLPAKKWLRGNDTADRAGVYKALATLHPQAATNLHSALALVKSSGIGATDIYVVTDGLPTIGRKKCSIFSSKTTVSGKCRLELFYAAVKSFSASSATVNVVLLPIEGDPEAAPAYWRWASAAGGLMISPTESWP